MSDSLANVLILVPVFLISLSIHEYAHAWVAFRLGDPTAKLMGRLTMNPLAHADLIGTFVLPAIAIYSQMPFFGWAKPVPIDPRNFKKGRTGMALVALAGPISNLILALLATFALAFFSRMRSESNVVGYLVLFSYLSIYMNLILAFFNMLPIAPLDGSRVLQGILPTSLALRIDALERFGFAILLLIAFSGGFKYLFQPVQYVFGILRHFALSP